MHHLYHIGASKRRRSAGETRTQQPRPISPSYFLSTRCHIGIAAAAAARREQGKKKKVPEREREHTHNSPPRCLFQLQLSESVLRKIITQQQQPREPPSHYGQRGFNCACRDAFANHVFPSPFKIPYLCDFTSNVYFLTRVCIKLGFY
jgi:hypothetical protein